MTDPPTDPEQIRRREQERGEALVRSTENVVAPASLHAAVHAASVRTPRGGRRRRRVLGPLAAGAIAAVVVLVVVVLVSGSGQPLTVARTARLALAAPTHGAPAVDPRGGELLSVHVGSIRFPSYAGHADWRAIGARVDRVDDHHVQTVVYAVGAARAGYAVVGGRALPVPRGSVRSVAGVAYVVAPVRGGGELVTWRRAGHTCVIAGHGLRTATLLRLAVATQAV